MPTVAVCLQAFMLVFSLCLFTVIAGPTTTFKDANLVENTTQADSSTASEPLTTTVATTSVTMTTQLKDGNKLEDDSKNEKTDIEKEDPIDHEPLNEETKKLQSPQYLLYEVEKGIRKLTLKDIECILDIGSDEEVVSLALADKLGYLLDGEDIDPHVKVIEDYREQLVSELKHKKEEFKNRKYTVPPTPPPTLATTTVTEEDKGRFMEYRFILNRIDHLSVDQIDDVLDYADSIPAALGDALGFEFGRDDRYLEYLEEQGAEMWRDILIEAKERKVEYKREHPATAPPQDVGNNKEETPNRGIPQNSPDNTGPPSGTLDEDNNVPDEYESKYVVGNDLQWPERNPTEKQNLGEVYSDLNANSNDKDGTEETVNHSFEVDDVDDSENLEKTRSCFGGWHFRKIFILILVAIVVGYLCVPNRKKGFVKVTSTSIGNKLDQD